MQFRCFTYSEQFDYLICRRDTDGTIAKVWLNETRRLLETLIAYLSVDVEKCQVELLVTLFMLVDDVIVFTEGFLKVRGVCCCL